VLSRGLLRVGFYDLAVGSSAANKLRHKHMLWQDRFESLEVLRDKCFKRAQLVKMKTKLNLATQQKRDYEDL
jgi:hypothetical protein